MRRLRATYTEVRHVKPKASRADSSELYIIAMGFKGTVNAAAPLGEPLA
ncbi:MAG: hypothetical protein ACK41P_05505 [Asticcacaulis sp.]